MNYLMDKITSFRQQMNDHDHMSQAKIEQLKEKGRTEGLTDEADIEALLDYEIGRLF